MNSIPKKSTYNVSVVETCFELEDNAVKFMESCAKNNLFLSFEWFHALEQYVYRQSNSSVVQYYVVTDNNIPVLIMPLVRDKVKNRLFTIEKIKSMANFYTTSYEPIFKSESQFFRAFDYLIEVISNSKTRVDIVSLKPLNKNREYWNTIVNVLNKHFFVSEEYFCFGNWYLELKGDSYDNYMNSLPSKLKNTIVRKNKKLDKEKNHYFNIYSDFNDVKNNYADFKYIYDHSWKCNESYPNFVREMTLSNTRNNMTRLGILTINDQAVAAQLWFVKNKMAYIYKLAHDDNFKKYSIGTLLTAYMMKHVIDIDKVSKVDFLTGDDDYKKDWMSHRTERWGILAYNKKTVKGFLLCMRYLLANKLKTYK